MMRIVSTQFLLFLGVALSGCNAAMDDVSTEPEEVVPVEGLTLFDVKVSQQAVLFTKLGESVQLTARGIDEFGNEVSVDSVVWTTSNGDEIVVDQDGTVTSVVEVGSSAVVAIADGVHSEPVIVAAVRPKENSVFYQDEQVLRPPELLEETENGNLVRMVLDLNVVPSADTVVIPVADSMVAGHVLTATQLPTGVEVVLNTQTDTPLFEEMELDFNVSSRITVAQMRQAFEGAFEVEEGANGSIVMTAIAQDDNRRSLYKLNEYCNVDGGLSLVDAGGLSITLLDGEIDTAYWESNGQLRRLWATVTMGPSVEFKQSLGLGARLGLNCTFNLPKPKLRIPAWGRFAGNIALEPSIVLGLGADVAGPSLDVAVGGHLTATAEAGYLCDEDGSCGLEWGGIEPDAGWTGTGEFDDYINSSTRVRPRIGLDMVLKFTWGDAFGALDAIDARIELFRIKAGISASADYAGVKKQAEDTEYASSYHADLHLYLGRQPRSDEEDGLSRRLGVTLPRLSVVVYEDSRTLTTSPHGTLNVLAKRLEMGETITFQVNLENTTLPVLGYNVYQVYVYRIHETESGEVTEISEIATIDVPSGAEQVEVDYTVTADDTGEDVAFVGFLRPHFPDFLVADVMPPLELNEDSRGTLQECNLVTGGDFEDNTYAWEAKPDGTDVTRRDSNVSILKWDHDPTNTTTAARLGWTADTDAKYGILTNQLEGLVAGETYELTYDLYVLTAQGGDDPCSPADLDKGPSWSVGVFTGSYENKTFLEQDVQSRRFYCVDGELNPLEK